MELEHLLSIEAKESFEFDLNGIGLENFFLFIDEENCFIYNDFFHYEISENFIHNSSSLVLSEINSEVPLILTQEQKEEIIKILKNFKL